MAGDQLSATTQYYYQNAVTNTTGNNLTTSIVTALIQSILGSPATGLAKGNTTPISTELNADPLFLSKTAPDANNATGTNPKAYMTIVFFDERFNYVAENSMALRVSQQGDNAAPLVLANIKAPKNGFAYICPPAEHGFFYRKNFYFNCKYIRAIAATVISNKVSPPKKLDSLLLVNSFITFLLLPMCIITAIKTGAVIPYNIAV